MTTFTSVFVVYYETEGSQLSPCPLKPIYPKLITRSLVFEILIVITRNKTRNLSSCSRFSLHDSAFVLGCLSFSTALLAGTLNDDRVHDEWWVRV